MTEFGMERYSAGIHARQAAEYFFLAHAVREFDDARASFNLNIGYTELRKAAALLGFELKPLVSHETVGA